MPTETTLSVSFFQSYNLIGHLGIIENVELGMTLSGVSKDEKRKRAEDALHRVGLTNHMHKSQISYLVDKCSEWPSLEH